MLSDIGAIPEFKKILGPQGIVLDAPIGALSHLQLGRAYAIQGDKVRAKVAYEDSLALSKDADRDVPILKRAQAEYAKLE